MGTEVTLTGTAAVPKRTDVISMGKEIVAIRTEVAPVVMSSF